MRELTCDVAVIGAGTAGISAHRAATEAGARAVLIERGPGGTTCARVGCMPSKLLLAAATAAHDARRAGLFGVRIDRVSVDGPAMFARLRAERDRFVGGVLDGLDKLPADQRLEGRARFLDAETLAVGDHTRLRFRAAVIATGSSPSIPKPLQSFGERVLTTDTVFELPDLPASLAILGAGPVGIEMAQGMARLGVPVTVLDAGTTLAGLSEPSLVTTAAAIFAGELELHLETKLDGAEATGDGLRLAWTGPDGRRGSGVFARVLAATGRPPNVADLGLDAAGLRLDGHGLPAFDARSLVCDGAPILIAGDANAERPVLHEANRQGALAGRNAAALAGSGRTESPEPWVRLAMVFTHPQAASVGAPYDSDEAGGRRVGGMDFADQGRARIEGLDRGGLRIWASATGRLLGGEMLGPGVEHLAHILAYAVQDGLSAQDLRDRPVYHPTLEEGLGTALSDLIRKGG